jgi:hypothetical protein
MCDLILLVINFLINFINIIIKLMANIYISICSVPIKTKKRTLNERPIHTELSLQKINQYEI